MKKRLLSLLLVGAMAASLLTGCGNTDNGGQDEQKVSSSTEEQKSEQTDEQADEQELTTVRILAPITAWHAEQGGFQLGETPVSKVLYENLEEIGLRLEVEVIDYEQLDNIVNTRMASGTDLPDMISFVWGSNGAQKIKEWADAGLVYELNALLDEYDEDDSIRTFYREKAAGALEKVTFEDGSLYWFSYLYANVNLVDEETGIEYINHGMRNLTIRKDWAEAVGEEVQMSYTAEELLALLKKMQDEDANGNGKADEVIYVDIDNFSNGFAKYFGLSNQLLGGYFEGEYKVFSNFYHENFPAYIELMQEIYNMGLYDTEALSSTYQQMVSEDRVSALYDYTCLNIENNLTDPDDDTVYYSPVILDADGDLSNGFYHVGDSYNATPYCQYFIPTTNENPEAVIRLMDYVYTDEFALLDMYGILGTAVVEAEDGYYKRVESDDPDDENMWSLNRYGITEYVLPQIITTPAITQRYNENMTASEVAKYEVHFYIIDELMDTIIDNKMYEFYTPELAMATEEEQTFISEKKEVLTTYAQELLTDLILGNKSLDDLPEYQKEMEDLGLLEYLDIMQAQCDRAHAE